MKRKTWIPVFTGLIALGMSLPAFADTAAERKSFSDDFLAYSYASVDSARYTLYGPGRFASCSGKLRLLYDADAESNGVFVNIADIAGPGETISLSYKFSNGNYSTPVSSSVSFYCDEEETTTEVQTETVAGKGGSIEVALAETELTVPQYESSAYIYIKSKVKDARYDDLSIQRTGEYVPTSASVTALTEAEYGNLALTALFTDECTIYGTASNIPTERYQVNGETAVFKDNNSSCLDVCAEDQSDHGLRINMNDIIAENGLKAGDSFYLTFYYGCNNVGTASTMTAHMMINGVDSANLLLADNVKSSGSSNKVTLYAKFTLPDNLPEDLSDAYLVLQATKVNHAYFKNIKISSTDTATEGGAQP